MSFLIHKLDTNRLMFEDRTPTPVHLCYITSYNFGLVLFSFLLLKRGVHLLCLFDFVFFYPNRAIFLESELQRQFFVGLPVFLLTSE